MCKYATAISLLLAASLVQAQTTIVQTPGLSGCALHGQEDIEGAMALTQKSRLTTDRYVPNSTVVLKTSCFRGELTAYSGTYKAYKGSAKEPTEETFIAGVQGGKFTCIHLPKLCIRVPSGLQEAPSSVVTSISQSSTDNSRKSIPNGKCDQLAGYLHDKNLAEGVDGVLFDRINPGPAIEACKNVASTSGRYAYQYARALRKNNDYKLALGWFSTAWSQGYTLAATGIGEMHEMGEGLPVNKPRAIEWYSKAVRAGDSNGHVFIAMLRSREGEFCEALSELKKADALGNREAVFWIGWMYESGECVKVDNAIALANYRRANEMGYRRAYSYAYMVSLKMAATAYNDSLPSKSEADRRANEAERGYLEDAQRRWENRPAGR